MKKIHCFKNLKSLNKTLKLHLRIKVNTVYTYISEINNIDNKFSNRFI